MECQFLQFNCQFLSGYLTSPPHLFDSFYLPKNFCFYRCVLFVYSLGNKRNKIRDKCWKQCASASLPVSSQKTDGDAAFQLENTYFIFLACAWSWTSWRNQSATIKDRLNWQLALQMTTKSVFMDFNSFKQRNKRVLPSVFRQVVIINIRNVCAGPQGRRPYFQ